MKKIYFSLLALCVTTCAWAANFVVPNEDNVNITYNILSEEDLTCEVMYALNDHDDYAGDIVIPEIVEYEGQTYTVVAVGKYAFSVCDKLTSVVLPNTITEIKDGAFWWCSALQEVNIPTGVVSIGNEAFYRCYYLSSVSLPQTILSIGERAFENCYDLTSLTLPRSITNIPLRLCYGCYSLKSVNLPSGVTSIGKLAFYECEDISNINFPENLTEIGDSAFAYCESLTSVDIQHANIGSDAFSNCTYLRQVTLGEGIETIGVRAFAICENLRSIVIPESVTWIGHKAFYACMSMTSAVVPNAVVCDYCFSDCYSLADVTLGDGVTLIGEDAFSYCSSLVNISIGKNVEEIEYHSFLSCSKLETMISYNPNPPICGEEALSGIPQSTCVLYVPKGALEDYAVADQWRDFYNVVEMAEYIAGSDSADTSTTGIDSIDGNASAIEGCYSVGGQRLSQPEKGVNIVRMSDGSTKKILVR